MAEMVVKKDYELRIDEYTDALQKYKKMEEKFLSGEVAAELAEAELINDDGGSVTASTNRIRDQFQEYVRIMQSALEDANAKLNVAKNAIRQVVQLTPMQERGPEGKPTTLSYGPLNVNSVTKRWFDVTDLLKLSAKHQVMDRLLSLTGIDKDGKEYKLVEQRWDVDYENVYKWLKEQTLLGIISGAYGEKDETPQVKGAKPLAFLGEKLS